MPQLYKILKYCNKSFWLLFAALLLLGFKILNIGFDEAKILAFLKDKGDKKEIKESVQFIVKNSVNMQSDKVVFLNEKNEKVSFKIDSFAGKESFQNFLDRNGYIYDVENKPDHEIITNADLAADILLAYQTWKKYQWSRSVSFETFINYLLPYKVGDEAPEKWRQFFYQKYKSMLDSLNNGKANAYTIYDNLIDKNVWKWFRFSDKELLKLSPNPSFTELMCTKEGECYRCALLFAYILRSVGVPATIDVVPKWGHYNGGHAEVVFISDSTEKLRPLDWNRLKRGTKVFRLTFKNQRTWTDSIKPFIGDYEFQVSFLKDNNRWLDVTNEHSATSDVPYQLIGEDKKLPFAYICVYNFGRWEPIFWGRNINDKVVFRNMARSQLYQVALPDLYDGYRLTGDIFSLNEDGSIVNYKPDLSKTENREITFRWLDTTISYSFWYLENGSDWRRIDIQKPTSKSTINFSGLPVGAVFRISRAEGDPSRNRIISFVNGKQEWW